MLFLVLVGGRGRAGVEEPREDHGDGRGGEAGVLLWYGVDLLVGWASPRDDMGRSGGLGRRYIYLHT